MSKKLPPKLAVTTRKVAPVAPPLPVVAPRNQASNTARSLIATKLDAFNPQPTKPTKRLVPTTNVATSLDARARPVLDLVDGLRALGLQRDLPIPQVAVMGDQSSGKSSVLEAISGIAFPRGSGLVTRCATQISMGAGDKWSAEIRAGSGGEAVPIESPADVTAKIEEMTTKLCDGEDFCADDVIEIKVRAPAMPDLTIIDLPGIVRTATKDQSDDVIGQVDRLLAKYLSQERTVILAVIPASSDIATVDILERAAKVDPDSSRTMGVLTKPDLVDAGGEREVMAVLNNVTKPLQHGYFMLKNRSQKESDDGLSLQDAKLREREWFEDSPYAKRSELLGVESLTTALSTLLVGHITSAIPLLQKEVKELLVEAQDELSNLGEGAPETPRSCRVVLSEISRKWISSMGRVCLQADYEELEDIEWRWEESGDSSKESPSDDRGSRKMVFKNKEEKSLFVLREQNSLSHMFSDKVRASRPGFDGENDKFDWVVSETEGETTSKKGDVWSNRSWTSCCSVTRIGDQVTSDQGKVKGKITKVSPYFRGELKEKIALSRGRELPGFMNFGVFKSLMASYIRLWEAPATTLRTGIFESVEAAGLHFFEKHTKEYGYAERLRRFLTSIFQVHLRATDSNTSLRMKLLLDQEAAAPMTMNHYLWDTINKLRDDRTLSKLNALKPDSNGKIDKAAVIAALKSDVGNDSNESQEVNDMLDMLKAYWKLAMKRYVDETCAIVSNAYTSEASLDSIAQTLDKELMGLDDAKVEKLFSEPHAMTSKRCTLQRKVERLTKAAQRLVDF